LFFDGRPSNLVILAKNYFKKHHHDTSILNRNEANSVRFPVAPLTARAQNGAKPEGKPEP